MKKEFPDELLAPACTLFRRGGIKALADKAMPFGEAGVIIHSGALETSGRLARMISTFPEPMRVYGIRHAGKEPSLDNISSVIASAREFGASWIAGIGGGSVLDLAKAAAGLFNASKDPAYYQDGGKVDGEGIPFIAVPTTAGTGSEATPNSVITNSTGDNKVSIRDGRFMADVVILDADLLDGIPPKVLSYSAMDAFTQAYESYVSRNATWFSEALSLKALVTISENILPACRKGRADSLEKLLLSSYLAGIALASSRLGVIHGLAHPLGALYSFPHGLICASLLPSSVELNREYAKYKYRVMSESLGADLSERTACLLKELGITSPFKGKEVIQRHKIISHTLSSGSTAANPKAITAEDVEKMLERVFGA